MDHLHDFLYAFGATVLVLAVVVWLPELRRRHLRPKHVHDYYHASAQIWLGIAGHRTEVTRICKVCGERNSVFYRGAWTLEQLNWWPGSGELTPSRKDS